MEKSNPVIVIMAEPSESTRIVYHFLKQKFDIKHVVLERPVSKLKFIRKRIARFGYVKTFGQILFRMIAVPALYSLSRRRIGQIKSSCNLIDERIEGAELTIVDSVNSEENISILKHISPDIVVVNGTRIVSEKVLKAVNARFINIHAGITPLYRGVHGAYWALAQGDPSNCGVTVHFVEEGIDTGKILKQAIIQPTRQDNFVTYPLLQLAKGVQLLAEAIEDLINGKLQIKPCPIGESRLWAHPTLGEYVGNLLFRGIK